MQVSKLIAGLLCVQTVILAALAWQVLSLKTDMAHLSTGETVVLPQDYSTASQASPTSQNVNLSTASLTAIRTLVQDEIQIALKDLPAATPRSSQNKPAAPEMKEPDIRRIEQQIDTKINSLSSLGTASRQDVDDVFYLIGQLPPERRQRALQNLNRAINQGQINVRL